PWLALTTASAGKNCPAACSRPSNVCTRSTAMANVVLGVTGSVAAIRTPELYQDLKRAGHGVKVVATAASVYFFDPAGLDPEDPAAVTSGTTRCSTSSCAAGLTCC